ncbi:hypothetical protein [Aestuariivirga sp.]|uniref:hypothetical protein n=1 Tax=Aestuariivirga sp. TaxID=2650926 RepID=UPI0039E2932F
MISLGGIILSVVFLGLGLLELALVQRFVYPPLRWRHEKAKLTQSQGMDPGLIMLLVRVQSLLVMPVLGYVLGSRFKGLMG